MVSFLTHAQTEQQRAVLAKSVNEEALKPTYKLALQNRKKAILYAKSHNEPIVIHYKDGYDAYLSGITTNNRLLYLKAYNIIAAQTTNTSAVYPDSLEGLTLTGQDMNIGVWDEGKVLDSHELFLGEDKVLQIDEPDEYGNHATHVSGTLAGSQLLGDEYSQYAKNSRGMAYNAQIKAWSFDQDIAEIISNQNGGGVLVSNHSYGFDASNFSDDVLFGNYVQKAAIIDAVTYNSPFYLPVVAAGNDRETYNLDKDGYDLITGMGVAKNTLTVAAVYEVFPYNGPESVQMPYFSNWGPTDDRRIKPDIAGQGVGVLSSVAKDADDNLSTNSYAYYNGTSMATPNVAGSLILLQEYSSELNNGQFLKAATLKGLAIHTAREAGENPGPDVKFGWGLLNLGAAADLMLIDNEEGNTSKSYEELILDNQQSYTQSVIAEGGNTPLKVTIVWTDPNGEVQSDGDDGLDDTTPRLVNDLDLALISGNDTTYLPYKIDEEDSLSIVTGINNVDNVEQVFIDDAQPGEEFSIEITHKGELEGSEQAFSLIISGVESNGSSASVKDSEQGNFKLYPNPAKSEVHIQLSQVKGEVDIEIFDLTGRQVYKRQYSGISELNNLIKTESFQPGVYLVKISSARKIQTKKLIVK